MPASFPKTQFPPVAFVPLENLPACRHAGPPVPAGPRPAPRPVVLQLRPIAGATGVEFGFAERYTLRGETVAGASASTGRFIDVYA